MTSEAWEEALLFSVGPMIEAVRAAKRSWCSRTNWPNGSSVLFKRLESSRDSSKKRSWDVIFIGELRGSVFIRLNKSFVSCKEKKLAWKIKLLVWKFIWILNEKKSLDDTHFSTFNYASICIAYTLRKLRNVRIIHHMHHISHLEQPKKLLGRRKLYFHFKRAKTFFTLKIVNIWIFVPKTANLPKQL